MERSTDSIKSQLSPKSISDTESFQMTRYRSSSTSGLRHSPPVTCGPPLQQKTNANGNEKSHSVKSIRSDSLPYSREKESVLSSGDESISSLLCRERSMSGGNLGCPSVGRGGSVSPRGRGMLLRKDLNASITSEFSDTSERLSRKDSSLSNSFESSEGESCGTHPLESFDGTGSPKAMPRFFRHGLAASRPAARDLRLVTSRIARVDSDAVSSPDVSVHYHI